MLTSRALGLVLGVAADTIWADPQKHHPVAYFGSWASWLEGKLYSPSLSASVLYTATAIAPVLGLGCILEHSSRKSALAHVSVTAVCTWAVLGARTLQNTGQAMASKLEAEDLEAARQQLSHLCSRDPQNMSASDLARATVESLAENTNDAMTASLFWGALAGVPGLLVHRGLNTLDAMVGYHNSRYELFGKVSARADDLAGWTSARLTGLLACAAALTVKTTDHDGVSHKCDAKKAWQVMWRDHSHHPSPNGGWCEAAWAGALRRRLGGQNVYFGKVEQRPQLGDGPECDAVSLQLACKLVQATTVCATTVAALGLWAAKAISSK